MSFRRQGRPFTDNFKICGRVFPTPSSRWWTERIFLQRQAAIEDTELPLQMFRFMARHGLTPSSPAEHQVEKFLLSMAAAPPKGAELWHYLQEVLAPHGAEALRTMHSLGLLTALLRNSRPLIRWLSATIRTSSQWMSTFVAIENLHALRKAQSKWDRGFGAAGRT